MAKVKGYGSAAISVRKKALAAQPEVGISISLKLAAAFSLTIFTSASLLFMVQPMIAKMLLPYLGGAPAVWTTCMVFFQAALLLGYAYAHFSGTRLSLRNQVFLQMGLLLVAGLFLPISVPHLAAFASGKHQVLAVFGCLALSVGLPFFALSASAPLLQNWFARSSHQAAKDPYFLYAASNLGSMLVLLAYPTVIEPVIGLAAQSRVWAIGYTILFVGYGACAYLVNSNQSEEAEVEAADESSEERPSVRKRITWVALAFVPSTLMLGVTTYFTTDIATIPLLWIMPLTLYLISFILVFAKVPAIVHQGFVRAMPFLVVGLMVHMFTKASWSITSTLAFHLVTFFSVAMVYHGEVARTRPSSKYLTEFYLLMSLGGVLGGVFNGILAPQIFKTAAEYPTALVLACLLLPGFYFAKRESLRPRISMAIDIASAALVGGLTYWLLVKWPLYGETLTTVARWLGQDAYDFHRFLNGAAPAAIAGLLFWNGRTIRFGLAVAAFGLISTYGARFGQQIVHQDRSFFGILKVADDSGGNFRTLINGTTLHGRQAMVPELRKYPLTYYHENGPVGSIFREFQGSDRVSDYAVIGLGTGTLSTYARPKQKVTIYEIDDAVVKVATTFFRYLSDSAGDWKLAMGDARLKLTEAPDQSYGLILVDAFSSDAIPVHMLTQEAIRLYIRKLANRGMVAIHTSNRYLSLEPVLAALAKDSRLIARVMRDPADDSVGKMASTWVVIARDEDSLGSLAQNPRWEKMEYMYGPTWTDDFTSVLPILK